LKRNGRDRWPPAAAKGHDLGWCLAEQNRKDYGEILMNVVFLIYHRTDDRVQAHIFVAALAFRLSCSTARSKRSSRPHTSISLPLW
jgi:hypothetical protein